MTSKEPKKGLLGWLPDATGRQITGHGLRMTLEQTPPDEDDDVPPIPTEPPEDPEDPKHPE